MDSLSLDAEDVHIGGYEATTCGGGEPGVRSTQEYVDEYIGGASGGGGGGGATSSSGSGGGGPGSGRGPQSRRGLASVKRRLHQACSDGDDRTISRILDREKQLVNC